MRDGATPTKVGSTRLAAALVAGVLTSSLVACGSPSQPATPGEGELDWAAGAPSVSPKYTEEEAARLYVCPLVSTAVFAAGHSKDKGIPLEKVEAEIAEQPTPADMKELVSVFAKQTYADEYTDLVQYTQSTNEQCVEKVGGISGARAERAVFCLGRHLTALAAYRLKGEHSRAELAAKLSGLPGYTEQALDFGYGGKQPSLEGWTACAESQE